jgi:hypothetical protein
MSGVGAWLKIALSKNPSIDADALSVARNLKPAAGAGAVDMTRS